MNPYNSDKLEAAIHGVLRRLPDRKAPAGLEGRVFAELARRAALPWWRKSFSHWPSTVRMGFVAGSVLAGLLMVLGLITLSGTQSAHQVSGSIANSLAWLTFARDLVSTTEGKARILLAATPSVWLYGAVGTVAVCYAALAAIGAATYRAVTFARQAS